MGDGGVVCSVMVVECGWFLFVYFELFFSEGVVEVNGFCYMVIGDYCVNFWWCSVKIRE